MSRHQYDDAITNDIWSNFFLTSGKETEIRYRSILVIFSSTCSVIGALIIISSFVLIKSVRNSSRCIVVVMAFADIAVALPALISEIVDITHNARLKTHTLCKIQSLFMSTGAQVSFIWTAGLAQHMYLLVAHGAGALRMGFLVLYLLSFAVLTENLVLFNKNILGGSRNISGIHWCWINLEEGQRRGSPQQNCNWMIWNGKLLEITMYGCVLLYYTLLYYKVKELRYCHNPSTCVTNIISRTGKIVAIPFVFVLTRIWGTALTLWLVHNNCHRPQHWIFTVLLTIMSFCDVAQGWVNFILYYMTTNNEYKLWEKAKLVVRSVPYLAKKKRNHISQNSCLTYNTSGAAQSCNPRNSTTRGSTSMLAPVLGSRTSGSSDILPVSPGCYSASPAYSLNNTDPIGQ